MLDGTLNIEGIKHILTAGGANSKALRPEDIDSCREQIFQSDLKTKKDQIHTLTLVSVF